MGDERRAEIRDEILAQVTRTILDAGGEHPKIHAGSDYWALADAMAAELVKLELLTAEIARRQ